MQTIQCCGILGAKETVVDVITALPSVKVNLQVQKPNCRCIGRSQIQIEWNQYIPQIVCSTVMQDTEYNLVCYNEISVLNRYEVYGLQASCNKLIYRLKVEQDICFKKYLIIGTWLISLPLKNFSTVEVLAERLSSSAALNTFISLFRI